MFETLKIIELPLDLKRMREETQGERFSGSCIIYLDNERFLIEFADTQPEMKNRVRFKIVTRLDNGI